jgi:methyltransferase FkbM-like protein
MEAMASRAFCRPDVRLLPSLVDVMRSATDMGPRRLFPTTGTTTARLDRMALGEIRFVKIDVEDHELDVLTDRSGLRANCLPNLRIEIGRAGRRGSLAEVRGRLDPLGYLGLRLNRRGLLKVLSNDAELKGSPNVIFIPMNRLLSDQTGSASFI